MALVSVVDERSEYATAPRTLKPRHQVEQLVAVIKR
jgi:hypothetical protein